MEPKESVVGGEADIPSDNQNRPLLTHFGLFSQPKSSVYDRQIYVGSGFLTCDLYNVLKCPASKSRKFLVMLTPAHFSYGCARLEKAAPQSHY